jgi:adenylyl- and sulfurtransferase ThiI
MLRFTTSCFSNVVISASFLSFFSLAATLKAHAEQGVTFKVSCRNTATGSLGSYDMVTKTGYAVTEKRLLLSFEPGKTHITQKLHSF